MVARANINGTCAACHRGVVDRYQESIHGEIFADSPEDAPVCTSCHSAHQTEQAMDDAFLLTVVERCSSCHEEMGYTFSRNYHGQVTGMGYTRAAQCPDCHGAHNILSTDDPASMADVMDKALSRPIPASHVHATSRDMSWDNYASMIHRIIPSV